MPFRLVTTASTAIEIPRLKSIAFIPAATDLHPSVNIAFVKTVAHVVPGNSSDVMVRIASTSFLQSKNTRHFLTVDWSSKSNFDHSSSTLFTATKAK